MKLLKTQLHKIRQSREFSGKVLGPLLKTGLPLIGNILEPLAKNVLIPLGLTAAATDKAIHEKTFGSGVTTSIISNKEMNNMIKIVTSLEKSGLLIKGVSKTIKNEAKEQRGFLGRFLGKFIFGASLLGNLVKAQLQLVKIFNAASSFSKF